MKKKIGIWLAAFFIILQIWEPVYAAPENNSVIEAVSGYCLGDEMYVFFRMDNGYDLESLKVNLQSEDISSNGEGTVVPIIASSSIVHYIFLVDRTGSMREHIDIVNDFVEALITEEKQEAFYTIATFGERFEVLSENLTDKNTVMKVLTELDYGEQYTDPYTGVENALAYLDNYSIRSGDVINLVVITDGEPDLKTEDTDESREVEKELAQSVADKIANTPEVIINTLCTAEWDAYAYASFSVGRGIHEKIDDGQDATAAGKKIARYVDSLYRTSFKLSEVPSKERFSVELQIKGNSLEQQLVLLNVSIESVPNLKMFSNDIMPETAQEDSQEESGNEDTQESVPEIKIIEDEGNENIDVQGGEMETAAENEAKEWEENNAGISILLIIILVICALVIAGISIIFFIKKKASNDTKETIGAVKKSISGSIVMKLEVYAGNCISKTSTLYLVDSLTIGSSPECNLRFIDSDMAPLNSRIFIKDQMIYIEDMNSRTGTALGGMRIQGKNRLRSGDVISIGEVEFCLKF